MITRKKLAKMYWILNTQLGVDPRKLFRSLKGIPRYLRDLRKYKSTYKGKIELVPCLHDWFEEAGSTQDEYFLQDLLVAKKIFQNNPVKHVDIGSRIDGFVAHVASYREIEVFDVRPITTVIPGISFKQADLMNPTNEVGGYCDSLSCLHALEHFGLGRYCDPIDPKGFESGFVNMIHLLQENGVFYLSVPIGIERVEFNANRVFDPRVIVDLGTKSRLKLENMTVIESGKVRSINVSDAELSTLANQRYALGIFTFSKKN